MKTTTSTNNNGFALLLSLIVVSVVLAIGLSLLTITLKQYTLSATGRESERAFSAATAGIECMRYYRTATTRFLTDNPGPGLYCTEGTVTSPNTTLYSNNNETVRLHEYQYNTDGNVPKCVDISFYITNPQNWDVDFALSNEGLSRLTCRAGTTCTIIFSRGYNRPCDDLDAITTVQRELTVQF